MMSSAMPSAKNSCSGSPAHIGKGEHRHRRLVRAALTAPDPSQHRGVPARPSELPLARLCGPPNFLRLRFFGSLPGLLRLAIGRSAVAWAPCRSPPISSCVPTRSPKCNLRINNTRFTWKHKGYDKEVYNGDLGVSEQLVTLAARHGVPAIYRSREFAAP